MKPIRFSQDISAIVQNNQLKLITIADCPQAINQYSTTHIPFEILSTLDINSKEFWELVKRAASGLRLMYVPITKQYELSMVIEEAATAIQNTMVE